MKELGVYHPVFDPAIHTLAMMEREHQRTVKVWKASGSRVDTDIYQAVERQRRDILAHRDALGLTPKGLKRLTPKGLKRLRPSAAPDPQVTSERKENVLELIRSKFAEG